ncbi:MAG: hypothetical protein Q9N67_09480 [Ghiorsea sp.]|nr:hypothetical protein [Ghiorsea sp.]
MCENAHELKKHLTIHAGLVPVMRFLGKLGFSKAFHRTVEHRRAHNARYQLSDAVELPKSCKWHFQDLGIRFKAL